MARRAKPSNHEWLRIIVVVRVKPMVNFTTILARLRFEYSTTIYGQCYASVRSVTFEGVISA